MSLKRILGTMLATRMGGRGGRRGALGTAGMLGGLGRRRRSGLAGKAGLAALGYMAYKAYQDHQSRSAAGSGATGGQSAAGTGGSGSSLSGMVQDLVDKVTGDTGSGGAQSQAAGSGGAAQAGDEEMRQGAQAAESLSDDTALLLIRAMITAAYSDGAMSTEERQRIMSQIDEAGGDAEDRAVMEREIANPKPLDDLLPHVTDEETAEEFYLASRAAVDGESEANRAYLAEVRRRLDLSEEQVAEAEELAG